MKKTKYTVTANLTILEYKDTNVSVKDVLNFMKENLLEVGHFPPTAAYLSKIKIKKEI
jgi:uncharacterized cysteine cluster protein YcgN (CxxCxxCC family)